MVQQHFMLNDFSHVHIYTIQVENGFYSKLQIILRHWEHCRPYVAASDTTSKKGIHRLILSSPHK